MTRADFLSDPHVTTMMTWTAERFDAPHGWSHHYTDRQTQLDRSFTNIANAFCQYEWNGKPWLDNKADLDKYRLTLRAAFADGDSDASFAACADTLRWGGVWANNGTYLERRRAALLPELQHMSDLLGGDSTPMRHELLRDPADPTTEVRMNAGFVKIYSLLLDSCVIYDGRVGAALGLLARQFCESTGRAEVPPYLQFAYGSPKEGPNPDRPKTRNPSRGTLLFPKLRNDSRFHVEHTMRANWFLNGALALNPTAFSAGEDGFHELAAGLFMIGYDLDCSTVR